MNKIDLTDKERHLLLQIPLFNDLSSNLKQTLLNRLDYTVYELKKKDLIAKQGTTCKSLYILLKGKIRVDIIDGLGKEVLIEHIVAPRPYATPHLFSSSSILPATFTAVEEGILFTATKESVFKLISEEPHILKNFLCVTGNCNKCTVSRLHALSHKNVRGRLISYLLDHADKTQNQVRMVHNQVQLAEYLCVTRPALSKEFSKMIKEKIISWEGKNIRILNMNELMSYAE